MSSVQTHIAQRKTRKFVVTQNYYTSGERGPYRFPAANIESWAAAQNNVSQIGSLYIVNVNSNSFSNTLDNLNSDGHYDQRRTFTDLGKTIYIGTPEQSELMVFRLVQEPTDSSTADSSGDASKTYYIVVENNTNDVGGTDDGRFMVRVARV